MPQTAVTTDIHQSLDVHRDLAPEVALYPHFFINNLADPVDFVVSQISDPSIRIDVRPLQQLLARVQTDAKDVWQSRLDPLVTRKIDSRNSRHVVSPLRPPARAFIPVAACAEG